MPRGDRTGPNGMGPMTGRATGFCAGNNQPGFTTSGGGMGRGFGRGVRGFFGRGMGRWFGTAPVNYGVPANWSAPTKEEELASLKNQASAYEQGLKDINQRIKELDNK